MGKVSVTVNGKTHEADVEPRLLLVHTRERELPASDGQRVCTPRPEESPRASLAARERRLIPREA